MEALNSGDVARARRTFEQAAGAGEAGASVSVLGLADVAMFEGRYADAIASLPPAVLRDEAQGNSVGAAAKLVALSKPTPPGRRRGSGMRQSPGSARFPFRTALGAGTVSR